MVLSGMFSFNKISCFLLVRERASQASPQPCKNGISDPKHDLFVQSDSVDWRARDPLNDTRVCQVGLEQWGRLKEVADIFTGMARASEMKTTKTNISWMDGRRNDEVLSSPFVKFVYFYGHHSDMSCSVSLSSNHPATLNLSEAKTIQIHSLSGVIHMKGAGDVKTESAGHVKSTCWQRSSSN